jgi:hypothetical protein
VRLKGTNRVLGGNMMIKNIKPEEFDSIFFETEKTSSRVSAKELSHFIDDENKLRDMISKRKIRYQAENDLSALAAYEELEDQCQISIDTMKKTINGRLKTTRNFLYKFTVGLHMTLDEANKFFELNGGALRESCLADYICIHAILDKDDIEVFISDYEKHTGFKIGMRERQAK